MPDKTDQELEMSPTARPFNNNLIYLDNIFVFGGMTPMLVQ